MHKGKPKLKPPAKGTAPLTGRPKHNARPMPKKEPGEAPKGELLYGLHAVEEALKAKRRRLDKILLARDIAYEMVKEREALKERFANVLDLAGNVPVENTTAQALERRVKSTQHQGIALMAGPLPEVDLGAILDSTAKPHQILLLDGITDPHNLGALLRTALCAGFAAVVIPKDRAVDATPTVAKVSSGALEYMPLVTVTNLVTAIKELKAAGFWVAGLAAEGAQDIFKTDMRGDFALVVGSEGKGLRPLVREACDLIVAIPQLGPLDSLNASVAGSIAIYEIFRQQGA